MFRGEERWAGGRLGGKAAGMLGDQIRELGLARSTEDGHTTRLDGRTIDWSRTVAAA